MTLVDQKRLEIEGGSLMLELVWVLRVPEHTVKEITVLVLLLVP